MAKVVTHNAAQDHSKLKDDQPESTESGSIKPRAGRAKTFKLVDLPSKGKVYSESRGGCSGFLIDVAEFI